MLTQIYPDSVPEFRILKQANGDHTLQVRYISITNGYTGKWQDVPVVEIEK